VLAVSSRQTNQESNLNWFEYFVETYIQQQGCWTFRSVYVEITKKDKQSLGLHSMPRPEIDIVAYRAAAHELLLIEAKSFLNSRGVTVKKLQSLLGTSGGKYRILTWPAYQRIVSRRLVEKLLEVGMLQSSPKIKYGLAAGNAPKADRDALHVLAQEQNWWYVGPDELRDYLQSLAKRRYENTPETIASKMLAQ